MSRMSVDYTLPSYGRVDPTTIQHKFLVGYQGWFTCRGDGAGLGDSHDWSHWLKKSPPGSDKLATDLWPDMSRYPPSESYPIPGIQHKSGEQAFLFSSCNPKTVQRHFNWMACHGIDGVFLQRFVGQCDPMNPNYKRIINWRDRVSSNVRLAAEAEGRVFSLMYDVSGVKPNRVQQILEHDWTHIIRDECLLDSPNYLHEQGRPVVCLWGFGFSRTRYHPDTVRNIVFFLRASTPGGVYIIAGVPTHWRTGGGDCDPNPEYPKLWLELFDAISPWTIGRYENEEGATRYANEIMKADIEALTLRNKIGPHVEYIPVVLPGGSGYNMSGGRWAFNKMKREGGRFLWRQIYNATKNGARVIYGATWDEYDEGTALMPAVESKLLLPISHQCPLLALDEDGYALPADWYMRICGLAAKHLRDEYEVQEEFPYQTLREQNTWMQAERQLEFSADDEALPPPYYPSQSGSLAPVSEKIWLTSRQPPRSPTSRPLPTIPAGTPFSLDSTMPSGFPRNDISNQSALQLLGVARPESSTENIENTTTTHNRRHSSDPLSMTSLTSHQSRRRARTEGGDLNIT
ncbi:hypothetical protein FB446DRAFT_62095 [Lentinula raphanica]|nr:hypothetical protein FB446DRAFT_62095 [Lentinula raphanica]